jgi:hypothetical protein
MWKNKRLFAAFLVITSGLLYSMCKVYADMVPTRPGGDTSISSGTLVLAGIVVLVIAISSYLLLRRIRKSSSEKYGND